MQLGHIFISGIRFDTELHYAVKPNSRRVSYIPLPIKADGTKDQDDALMSLVQAVTVLTQKRFTLVAKSLIGQGITHPDKLSHESLLVVAGQSICVKHLHETDGADVDELSATVMVSIAKGHVGLLHLATDTQSYWTLIVGVEYDLATNRAKALLLLDSQEYEPWCTGHNARLELGKQFCIYRVLTGGYKAVQLKQMCILSQATTTPV
jgi:hypothetical protein